MNRAPRNPDTPERRAVTSASGAGSEFVATNGDETELLARQVKDWGGISVARYRFPPGERKVPALPGHILRLHASDPHYLIQRLDGRTQQQTETRELITIIPAEMSFEQVYETESEDYNVVLPDQIVRRAAIESDLDPSRLEIRDCFCQDDPYVRQIGMALGAELQSESIGEQLYAEALGYALAVHLVRKYSAASPRELSSLDNRTNGHLLSSSVLNRVREYVEENLSARLTLGQIAGAANLSSFHFSRLFRASTGLSPHQYVLQRRTARARTLLVETNLSISEIAWQTGFADQSHLGRHIRRRYGDTPRRIRDNA